MSEDGVRITRSVLQGVTPLSFEFVCVWGIEPAVSLPFPDLCDLSELLEDGDICAVL